LYFLVFLQCFYKISNMFNRTISGWLTCNILGPTTCSQTMECFTQKNKILVCPHKHHYTGRICSLVLQIFMCLLLQLSSTSLVTSNHAPSTLPHFFRFLKDTVHHHDGLSCLSLKRMKTEKVKHRVAAFIRSPNFDCSDKQIFFSAQHTLFKNRPSLRHSKNCQHATYFPKQLWNLTECKTGEIRKEIRRTRWSVSQ